MNRHAIIATAALTLSAAGLVGFAANRPAPAPAATDTANAAPEYSVDKVHSAVFFRIKHAGITNFYGRFNEIDGSFTFDPEALSDASFDFSINTASVDTGNDGRDNHLRTPDFFNAKQFPTTSFTATGVKKLDGGGFELAGDLTLSGVTKPITANLEWLGTGSFRGNDIGSFEANFTFKRADFGMTKYLADDGGEGGGLGNTVTIYVSVEGVQK